MSSYVFKGEPTLGQVEASDVSFNGTRSGLGATDVQSAIEELKLSVTSSSASPKYIQLLEKFSTGSTGGNAVSNTWTRRRTNFIATDDTSLVTIVSEGVFSLPAGTYYIDASANFYASHEVKMRLYNLDDSSLLVLGSNTYSSAANNVYIDALLRGRFVLPSTKTLSLQYYAKNPSSSIYNLGTTVGDGSEEIWSIIDLWKLS
jgi:hypothetical protein